MGLGEIVVLAIALSMDAFAVAICKGLAIRELSFKKAAIVGLWFGFFQAFMPVIGFLLGSLFSNYIQAVDHWIAFILLGYIGINMIREALSGDDEDAESSSGSLAVKTMFTMAVATSIDALAVGITLSFLNVSIFAPALLIGIITFSLSALGVKIGNVFGTKYKSKAEIFGGIVLILLGLKILLEHLGYI